jgi:hypothetical protein
LSRAAIYDAHALSVATPCGELSSITVCWPHTVACAEKVLAETIAAYSVPNRTVQQIYELLKSGTGIDPLKDFAEAARAELQSIDVSLRESGDLSERRMR